ncbi:MAG: hypothetical protein QOG59_3255 [Solirubrobacteraceae bacterium]|nr:hypothetical protein [Solirubrobacteraceae bacterium]
MSRTPIATAVAVFLLGAGCAACGGHRRAGGAPTTAASGVAPRTAARHPVVAALPAPRHRPDPIVLVTAETRNQLVSVDARTGRLLGRVSEATDPENVVVGSMAIVVSSASHTVSLLDLHTLRTITRLRRFTLPHLVAVGAGKSFAYVSDDTAGTVTPIDLSTRTELGAVAVGAGAHHMALSPDGHRLWVALGETAQTIVILDTTNPAHPRVLRRWNPGFAVHDLVYSPDGRQVWISAASAPDVTVLDARTRRVRFRVDVGAGPQHIAFDRAGVYLTSGYGSRIERVRSADGRLLRRAVSPYGSFELDVADGYVVTASLFAGKLVIYDTGLHLRHRLALAPATRDEAILTPRP